MLVAFVFGQNAGTADGTGGNAMKRATLIAGVIGLSGFGLVSQAQNVGSSVDEDAFRKIIVAMTEGFNRHDGRAAAQMYEPDARFVTARGEVMNGQPAIEKGLASILSSRARNASQRTLDVSVKFIRPDVALAHVTNELSGLVSTDGQALPSQQELSLRVFVKDAGAWRVAAFQNTMIRPFNNP
jgi:uncharacterized protein (TIGR02246 family)